MFSATFWHEITLYAIDIDKKRFRTPFLALQNHFENRPSTGLNFPQHLRMTHILLVFLPNVDAAGNSWKSVKRNNLTHSSGLASVNAA